MKTPEKLWRWLLAGTAILFAAFAIRVESDDLKEKLRNTIQQRSNEEAPSRGRGDQNPGQGRSGNSGNEMPRVREAAPRVVQPQLEQQRQPVSREPVPAPKVERAPQVVPRPLNREVSEPNRNPEPGRPVEPRTIPDVRDMPRNVDPRGNGNPETESNPRAERDPRVMPEPRPIPDARVDTLRPEDRPNMPQTTPSDSVAEGNDQGRGKGQGKGMPIPEGVIREGGRVVGENPQGRPMSPSENGERDGKDVPRVIPPVAEERIEGRPMPQVEIPDTSAPSSTDEGEKKVVEATQEVRREVEEKKLTVDEPEEAKELIQDIIGVESPIARAEASQQESERRGNGNGRPDNDSDRGDRGDRRDSNVNPSAVSYLLGRLRGEIDNDDAPYRWRDNDGRPDWDRDWDRDGRDRDGRDRDHDRWNDHHHYHPYYHGGRRFVYYRSRNEVPAILLALSVLNRVSIQNANDVTYYQDVRAQGPLYDSLPPLPDAYRGSDSYVVSYPVDEKSMISSDDILFKQGSTQFADPYSYDIVAALGAAMSDPSVDGYQFVVEGHASAEGDYESNMLLSQQRAERIVREIVRQGVSPDRLIPVGYGESEARSPANADESVRRQDRRVVVFKLDN